MADVLRVSAPVVARDADGWRVVATVDGAPLWFASPDVPLEPSAEAYASAVLPTAFEQGRAVEIVAPLSAAYRASAQEVATIAGPWWGWTAAGLEGRGQAPAGVRRPGAALAFSGGVDSFYSLLRGSRTVDVVVSAHGFDIDVEDIARWAAWEDSFREIAAATGTRAVVVRTNLRHHPVSTAISWERSHGGALAALGHLLSGEVGTLVIAASSFPADPDYPWGTHPRLDPCWSSDRLAIAQSGAAHYRAMKLYMIAGEPLVQRHLRVCWENRSPMLNCGECEKCVRTQIGLEVSGRLGEFAVFAPGPPLVERIDALPPLARWTVRIYQELLRGGPSPDVSLAVQRLIERTIVAP